MLKSQNIFTYNESLNRALSKRDYISILILANALLEEVPDNIEVIASRQAALIALGRSGTLEGEFKGLGESIFDHNDLTINYFDYLFHEKRFEELFYFIYRCATTSSLSRAKDYIECAIERAQHIRQVEMAEAESSLTCRAELPLYDRILRSFSQEYVAPSCPNAEGREPILYLQIDILLRQIAFGYHATGIQRAICELVKALSEAENVRVFFFRPEMNYPVSIASSDFLAVLDSKSGRDEAWSLLFGSVGQFGSCQVNGFLPSSIDIIVLLDCFWASPVGRLAAFLDECQCEKFLMIYDLIPLTVPGEPADDEALKVSLEVLETRVDGFLAISNFTRSMVERYLFQKGIRGVCKSVPLAQQKPSEFEVFLGNNRTSLADKFLIADLLDKHFILTVSSISARKRVLETAEAFQDTFESCPEWCLVIVGHDPGHDRKLTDALLDVCQKSEGRIVWLRNVGDGDLDRLYQHCEFVTYLSRIEGWGLPIGEALAYGKLPLVHRESSIPEVGGDLAVYCEFDRQSVASALVQIMQDEPLRKRVARNDLQKILRTWDDVAGDFLQAINFEAR